MIEWAVASSVLILILLLVRRCLKGHISLRLQYGLWGLVLVRLLVPVSFGSGPWSVLGVLTLLQPTQETAAPAAQGETEETKPQLSIVQPDASLNPELFLVEPDDAWRSTMPSVEPAVLQREEEGVRPAAILTGVWGIGAAGLALWLLWVNARFARRLRRSRTPIQVENCPLPVYVTGAADTPCLFGLFRPCIYVTQEVAADAAVLGHSLAHELTHFRHGDPIWAALRGLCLALHWYNPLVWAAAVLSRRDGELCCDEATVKTLGEEERAAYGRTLLAVTCQGHGNPLLTATRMTGSGKEIQERIVLLTKRPKTAFYTLASVLLIAVMAVGCTFTGAPAPGEEEGQGETWRSGAWAGGIAMSNLAPGTELVGSEDITAPENGSEFQYALAYSPAEMTLEFGLRGTDGTEYRQTASDGMASGSFCNIPAGTYRLFVYHTGGQPASTDDQRLTVLSPVDGVLNLYLVGEESASVQEGESSAALGYPGATAELNPINWTCSQADIPVLTDALARSDYLALYMDEALALRVTAGRMIETSRDGGLTWGAEPYETIPGEDFSAWLWEHEPLANFSMKDLQERLNRGGEVRHIVLDQGKEIYIVLDDQGAFLELVQEEKIPALLLDGQRLVFTSSSSQPFLCSNTLCDSFYDLMKDCQVISSQEAEQEWNHVMEHLEENGAAFF